MDGKQLRNSILQWAIQGKLVPQDPDDEPASVLLERIREEKARLVKEKKIKRDKNESIIFRGEDNSYYEKFTATGEVKCIDDEIPFDLPNGWAWCRLNHVAEIARGGSPRPIKEYLTSAEDGVNWIKIGDTIKGGKYIESVREKIKQSGVKRSRMVHAGDFLLTNSMSFGRPYILKVDGCIHDGWLVISLCDNSYDQDFLYYLLSSPFAFDQFCDKVSGAVVKNLNSDKVAGALFPLPPIEEQKRIVFIVESIIPHVECYSKLSSEQAILNDTLKSRLRKSILQQAIQGLLVEQNPDDEPVSVLLEKIKAEKERLIKEKKIKREKQESIIYRGDDNKYYENLNGKVIDITDQIPFDIPHSWQWVRLSTIFNITMGQSPNGNSVVENGTGMEFHQGKIEFQDIHLGTSRFTTTKPTKIATPNSLLLCVRAPVGVLNITQREICIGRGLCALKPYLDEFSTLLWFYLLSTYKMYFEKKATGSTFTAISNEIIKNTLVPLPPVDEQKRILKQILLIFQTLN